MTEPTPGTRFRNAVAAEKPLQLPGAINAYCAMMAERVGYKALYLSGAGVANASHGLPDLGITTLQDTVEDARRITAATELPLLADIDVGGGGAFTIARTIREMIRAGVAAVHIEDQILQKRCGHRPNKEIVSTEEMQDRIKAATDARTDESFVLMARTDALASEGLDGAIARACAYVEAGADMIFAEAMTDITHYRKFKDAVKVPLLANITEFGKTPLYTSDELAAVGVDIALYPLSAFRAMNKAALTVYESIRREGHQKNMVAAMQTREELYAMLNYHAYEQKLDALFGEKK
jgi:methylisocitrate lyase